MSGATTRPAIALTIAGAGAIAVGVLAGGALDAAEDPAIRLVGTALRWSVLGIGAWAVTVGVLGLLAALLGWGAAARAALRLGGARWGLALGVGVAAMGSGTAGAVAGPATTDAPEPTMPVASLTPVSMPEATLTPLDLTDPDVDTTAVPSDAAPETELGDLPGAESLEGDVWIVEQGDHLWAIAERVVLADSPGADDDAVTAYWLRLIDANRDRLLVPSEPDLIVPGQRLLLPPVAEA